MKTHFPRCYGCGLHVDLCICDELTPIMTPTHVVVLMHIKEFVRTSNTGRLTPLTLQNGEMRLRGLPNIETEADDLVGPRSYILFPDENSVLLTPELAKDGPLTLIVPDGNWIQAGKVRHREPKLKDLPTLRLPPGPPSRYRLRKNPDPDRICTFEAIARALGILEGPDVQRTLEDAFEKLVSRTLWTRGKIDSDEANIPEEARHRSGIWPPPV